MKTLKSYYVIQEKGLPFKPGLKTAALLSFALFSCFSTCFCQESKTAIQDVRVNILYNDIPNSLLVVSELEFDSISYSKGRVEPQKFERTKSAEFVVIPENSGKSNGVLSIFCNGTMIASNNYNHWDVPLPKAIVGGRDSGIIKKEFLLAQEGIKATLNDFFYDLAFEVISFDVHIPADNNMIAVFHSSSWQFSKEQKRTMSTLAPDQKILFENIRVKGPNGIREVPPIILTVQ